MDFQSAMETFAEAWVAANAGQQTQALALTRPKTPPLLKKERSDSPQSVREHADRSPRENEGSPKYAGGQSIASPPTNVDQLNNTSNNQNITTGGGNLVTPGTASSTPKISTPTSINENGLPPVSSLPSSERILPSPSLERKDFDFSKVNAKSLPLHCVVESVPSLQASLSVDSRNPWKRRPNIETDSYVIVAASTPWSEIVTTALQRLGYSMDIANTARGSLIIKNWKPIPLENISDNPVVPVSDILGELTSIITLRIVILRTKPSTFSEIKDKLLKLLVLQSHAVLRSTGCPLDEVTLSQICRSTYQNTFPFSGEISDEMRRKFDQWWSNQLSPQSSLTPKMLPFITPQPGSEMDFPQPAAVAAGHPLHPSRESLLENHHAPHPNMMVHPALQTIHSQYPSQKTRMRTSFDPEMELPKLQRWFQENPHPSRQQIQSYVIQLNSLESRRGRKPLDVNNVVYWFKNARAAQKRAEMRGQGIGNGFLNHQASGGMIMPHTDYKNSPVSEDIDNLSQHSDDIDDDTSRPSSPQLPLSLTTHERNRNSTENAMKDDNTNGPGMEKNNNNNESMQNGRDSTGEIVDTSQISNHGGSMQNLEQRSSSPKNSPKSEDLDMDDNDISQMDDFRTPSPDPRRDLSFPIVPNSMFSHSIMYMSHYMPGMGPGGPHPHHQPPNMNPAVMGSGGLNLSSLSSEERRKRNRTFIDPVTEVPKLEQWFAMNTHPSHNLILKYTEDLNRMPYRQKFPRLESKNVQFWFKNRRAKCKRLKMSLYDNPQMSGLSAFGHADRE
ncbi:LOW QUALITY PROTEIN: DNA-binding protein SATB2 [Hermetia illucens]|uniref:LOW QUALITY PROTEIN: DNA-binding protein SATB2 n=1 Tax=Hermetia illucens TaxID=343691 RepID=UPI0018CC0752|nr:LOW QUALITY PROTEIN: DNA-binding protein SATB2 [Hermetia illucens]